MVPTEIKKVVLASQILIDALKDVRGINFCEFERNGGYDVELTFFGEKGRNNVINLAKYYDTNIKFASRELYDEAYCECGDVMCNVILNDKEIEEYKKKCFELNVNFVDERKEK